MVVPSTTFNPAQAKVVRFGLLSSGFSCVLQMPTGSGKTFLVFQAMAEAIRAGKRAIYVCPLKALAEELASRWGAELGEDKVGVFTGDYGSDGRSYPVPFGEARLLVMTPERLDLCTRTWRSHWDWIPEVDLIAVDEFHLLADIGRGARLEGAIMRLRRLNSFARFICLSATLGNREELADWLGGVEFESTWRPVPVSWRIARFRKAQEKATLLASELASVRHDGGQSLVFVQSRKRAESLAQYLSGEGIRAVHHHAGMAHPDRKNAENKFRRSETEVLVATGTLEMGLNLPARRVFLYDLQGFNGSEFEPLSTNTVWQRGGRAGRPSLDDRGEVVLFAPQWDRDADQYLSPKFESIKSRLSEPAALAEQVLIEVQSSLSRSRIQLRRSFDASLSEFQNQHVPVEETVGTMIEAGMLRYDEEEEENDGEERLRVTPLGRVAIRHLLRPASVLHLKSLLDRTPNPTNFDLLLAIATTDDFATMTVDFEEIEELASLLGRYRSTILGGGPERAFRLAAREGRSFLGAVKSACVLQRWTETGDLEQTSRELNCYPFEVEKAREAAGRLLMAAEGILRIGLGEEDEHPPVLVRLQLLQKQVAHGLSAREATLTVVRGIGTKWARKLVAAGVADIHDLKRTRTKILVRIGGVSEDRAKKWMRDARLKVREYVRFEEPDAPRIPTQPRSISLTHDPYRLRRATELTVTRLDGGNWSVRGGLEPHIVRSAGVELSCDCADFAKGNHCKHLIAVRLCRGDERVRADLSLLEKHTSEDYFDLHNLWLQR